MKGNMWWDLVVLQVKMLINFKPSGIGRYECLAKRTLSPRGTYWLLAGRCVKTREAVIEANLGVKGS